MTRQIQHQDVLNIKTRFRLFFLSIVVGAVMGGAGGWQWTHKGMTTLESEIFNKYTEAWVYQQTGFGGLSIQNTKSSNEGMAMAILPIEKATSGKHQITATEFLKFMHDKYPKLAQEFDTKSAVELAYLPSAGALAGAVLLFGLAGLIKEDEGN